MTMMKKYANLVKKYAMNDIALDDQINLITEDKTNLENLRKALAVYSDKFPGDKQPAWLSRAIQNIKWESAQAEEQVMFLTKFHFEIQTELDKAAYDKPKADDPYDAVVTVMHDEDDTEEEAV